MRKAIIEAGVVVNVIEATPSSREGDPACIPDPGGQAHIGGAYDRGTGEFSPPPERQLPLEKIEKLKQAAYRNGSDPLFMDWQAAVAERDPRANEKRDLWLAARNEIKNRFNQG